MTLTIDHPGRVDSLALQDSGEQFTGVAVPYYRRSRLIHVGGRLCREMFAVGAFAAGLIHHPHVRLSILHAADTIAATTTDGGLSVWETPEGVRCRFRLGDELEWARVGIRCRRLANMSFKFIVLAGGEHWTLETGVWIRCITKAVLREVSIMDGRAIYPQTSIDPDD
jgi:phage head maturation protease